VVIVAAAFRGRHRQASAALVRRRRRRCRHQSFSNMITTTTTLFESLFASHMFRHFTFTSASKMLGSASNGFVEVQTRKPFGITTFPPFSATTTIPRRRRRQQTGYVPMEVGVGSRALRRRAGARLQPRGFFVRGLLPLRARARALNDGRLVAVGSLEDDDEGRGGISPARPCLRPRGPLWGPRTRSRPRRRRFFFFLPTVTFATERGNFSVCHRAQRHHLRRSDDVRRRIQVLLPAAGDLNARRGDLANAPLHRHADSPVGRKWQQDVGEEIEDDSQMDKFGAKVCGHTLPLAFRLSSRRMKTRRVLFSLSGFFATTEIPK